MMTKTAIHDCTIKTKISGSGKADQTQHEPHQHYCGVKNQDKRHKIRHELAQHQAQPLATYTTQTFT